MFGKQTQQIQQVVNRLINKKKNLHKEKGETLNWNKGLELVNFWRM